MTGLMLVDAWPAHSEITGRGAGSSSSRATTGKSHQARVMGWCVSLAPLLSLFLFLWGNGELALPVALSLSPSLSYSHSLSLKHCGCDNNRKLFWVNGHVRSHWHDEETRREMKVCLQFADSRCSPRVLECGHHVVLKWLILLDCCLHIPRVIILSVWPLASAFL